MLSNFKYVEGDRTIISLSGVHLEFDYDTDRFSITLDNGNVFVVSNNSIIKEEHTDNSDYFECLDGKKYYIELVP